jgi:hypothetical protein
MVDVPAAPASASAHASALAPQAATESVERPEAGIGRGVWEAPAWVFWVLLAAVVLGSAAYLLRRLGLLRLGRQADHSPPSSLRSRDPRLRRP